MMSCFAFSQVSKGEPGLDMGLSQVRLVCSRIYEVDTG